MIADKDGKEIAHRFWNRDIRIVHEVVSPSRRKISHSLPALAVDVLTAIIKLAWHNLLLKDVPQHLWEWPQYGIDEFFKWLAGNSIFGGWEALAYTKLKGRTLR